MTKHGKDFIQPPQFEQISGGLLVRAPAKINLSLLVAGRRPDGFHNVETVMAKISLYDELHIVGSDNDGIELICLGKYQVPAGEENLVYKACRLFFQQTKNEPKIKITLTKNIPAAAGLGGASSDAAAALLALNRLYGGIVEEAILSSLAGRLGSDVPFFLAGPMAFCSGRGEKIQKILNFFYFKLLLILPNISISTKEVYSRYKVDMPLFGELSSQIKSFINQNRLDLIHGICANMLEAASFEVSGGLADIKSRVERILSLPVCLSGSGSALFSVISEVGGGDIEITQRRITEDLGCECIVVSYNRW